ncbi:MAG: glycoside hydrolase family 20 zincin-like fold domain-containing protein [Phycisphaerae bacterium]
MNRFSNRPSSFLFALLSSLIAFALSALPVDGAEPGEQFRTKFDRETAPGRPTLICSRVDKGPVIDGDVDKDPVWQSVAARSRTRGAWTQLASKDVSGRQTVVYSCFDDGNVYFAFVCEESELQNVKMDGDLGTGHFLGKDDFVEVTLEVGGLQGDGQVYSFRANSRAAAPGWGGLGIPSDKAEGPVPLIGGDWHRPQCRSAGKLGPNRWMVEIAIPFDTLKKHTRDKGLAAPSRGDVLGLKLARYGALGQDPKTRMISTWNTDIVYPYIHICGSNGLLYFEDSSALVDGDFTMPQAASPWKRTGDVTAVSSATQPALQLAAGATLAQTAAVHPSSYYILRIEHDGKAPPELLVDGRKLELKDGKAGLWTADKQEKAQVTLQAKDAVTVRKVTMEYQPGEEPPGPYCLTNNYRRPERNIRALQPDAPDGSYKYVRIDYAGHVVADDNPAIKFAGDGSAYQGWAYDYNLRVEDLGGKEGWIPFRKGSLTAQNKPVFWNPANPGDYATWGRHPVVLDVDLGQEYWVQGLDILWPGPNIVNVEAWGKAAEGDEWTLLYMTSGQYVEPANRKPRRGYDSVRGLDSVIRYVRWRTRPATGDWSYPQMDGVQTFRVWGQPKGDHAGIKALKLYVTDKKVPPVKPETAVLDGDTPLIVPRPKKMELEQGWFLVNSQTRIVAQDHPEARRVARQVHDEILDRWQIDVAVQIEGTRDEALATRTADGSPISGNVIYLAIPKLNETARKIASEEGLGNEATRGEGQASAPSADTPGPKSLVASPSILDKPQSYGLRCSARRIVIAGGDAEGLYYGVQSMMMAMRWRNALDKPDGGSPALRCMKVLDSPGSVLERGVYHRRPYPVMLVFPESDIGRIKRICQLLSRFKFNVIYLGPHWDDSLSAGPRMTPWARKLLPKLCHEVREEFHIEIRPTILYEEGEGGSYWKDLSADALDLREHDPDENPREMGNSLNLCPLDERTYKRHFAMIDEILEDFDHPSKVWMFGQTYASLAEGARWAQCRRCVKSGKSPEELYAYFITRIAEHLQERHVKGLFRCPWLRYGGQRAAKDRRMISIDPRDLPAGLEFDLWHPEDPLYSQFNANKEFIAEYFKPAATANGPLEWPCSERYLQDAPQSETDMLTTMSGQGASVYFTVTAKDTLADIAEAFWYSPEPAPAGRLDKYAMSDFVHAWWYGHDRPAWRAGDRPKFMPLDLRPWANHPSHATGLETMEAGRPAEIDLRYLPTGLQTLAGVPFDIIDPATRNGNGLVMMGRPVAGTLPKVAATIREGAGPIPVGRKIASLAFLRKGWHCRTEKMYFGETWLRPTCRVVYDDDTWLVADCFLIWHAGLFDDGWDHNDMITLPYYRAGWYGNCPTGSKVELDAAEWVNPYPDKTVKHVDFFTPEFADKNGKRVSDMMEALVAMTAVEATPRDLAFWKARAESPKAQAAYCDLPPLLPPRREQSGVVLKPVGDMGGRTDNLRSLLQTAAGQIGYTLKPLGQGKCARHFTDIYDLAYCDVDFSDFGVEVTFDKPFVLSRVELRGPTSLGGHWGAFATRAKKADVAVEVSEDGKTWRKAGELRGISADADFLPVDLGGAAGIPVKAVRMTGTAGPYRLHYHPVQVQGDIFWRGVPHYNPSFTWRFVAPKGR